MEAEDATAETIRETYGRLAGGGRPADGDRG